MQERYTTKKYDPSKKIDASSKEALKEILRLSPSSINSQPWQFTFVSDKTVREELSTISWINTPKILDCDTVVVFSSVNDLDLFERQINEEQPQGIIDYYNAYLKPLPNNEIKAWFDKQLYLSVGVFLSACATMGIDATPMEGIEPENYDKVLGQTNYATRVAVAIGYRDPEDNNQPSITPKKRRPMGQVVNEL